jgi:hypothetical protein
VIANLPDLARALYPLINLCVHCGVVIDHRTGRWTDGGGAHWCVGGLLQHVPAPYVARSPTLGGLL